VAALRERVLEATLVRDQHRHAHLGGHVDAGQHRAGVGELWDHLRAHEARHLKPPQAGARERVDQLDLELGRDRLGLVLKAVAWADLPDVHRTWEPGARPADPLSGHRGPTIIPERAH